MFERMFADDFSEMLFKQAVRSNFEKRIAEYEKLPAVPISPEFRKRIKKLIDDNRRKKSRAKIIIISKKIARGCAACFIIVSVFLFLQPEVRASVKEVFVRWFGTHAQFVGESNEVIKKDWYLEYIPDNFSVTAEQHLEITNSMMLCYEKDNQYFSFSYAPDSQSIAVNNENTEFSQITDNGITYYLFSAQTSDVESSIIWYFDNYRFTVSGTIDIEELLKISKSIKEK
ncbi:MAG: DUF4367 domain-containing protein [Oscillospiraceae bacterium]|jgi:hypothetical protein|nr:DUF4367 domain-containing protein [Oscillospiraceae bacterium]